MKDLSQNASTQICNVAWTSHRHPHQSHPPKKESRELRPKFSSRKKQPSGPTPLRQIRTQNREHEQPKHRQSQDHHHHGATLQTPLYPATHGPLSTSSFSNTYPAPHSSVTIARHTCHPTPTLCTPVLALFSHYPLTFQLPNNLSS